MKKLSSVLVFCLFFILGMGAMVLSSAAYLDPSSLTFVISAIITAVVVGGASIGFYFNKLKRKLRRNKDDEPVETVEQEEVIDDDGEFDDFDDQAEE